MTRMRQRMATVALALAAGGLGAFGLVCASDAAGPTVAEEDRIAALAAEFEPTLVEWADLRAEYASQHDLIRAQYQEVIDPVLLAHYQELLAQTNRQRRRLEARLVRILHEMHALAPQHLTTLQAHDAVLEPLSEEIRLLAEHRLEQARHLHYGDAERALDTDEPSRWPTQAAVRFRPERAALEAIEEELGAALTSLQRNFDYSDRVRELDRDIVFWHYKQLMRALGRHHASFRSPTQPPAEAGTRLESHAVDPAARIELSLAAVNRELLNQLDRMKRLFPLSAFTRRAEERIIGVTAKRNLRELAGWPLVTVLALVTLLLFGYMRCLTAYLRRRQQEEENPLADSRIIRPAAWAVVPRFALPSSGRAPALIGRPLSPPSLSQRRRKPDLPGGTASAPPTNVPPDNHEAGDDGPNAENDLTDR